MSTSIHHESHAARANSEWQPRPALCEAMRRISSIAVDDPSAVITDRSLSFENFGERTTISAEPVNVDTYDGARLAEIVTVHTPLTSFKVFDENHYAFINIFATTGAVVRVSNGKDAIISRLPIFESDDEALADLYTPLIANAARLQVIGPRCGLSYFNGKKDDVSPADLALPGWEEPSRWGPSEFTTAEQHLRRCGAFVNAGDGGLTVEFPWEEGAVSAMAGDRTSLLRIRADEPHPAAGNGLFYRLDLPASFSEDEARRAAAKLNYIESESYDSPPFFGAWCTMPGSGTLSFAGFWPNLLFKQGTVTNIAFWSWARSRLARQALGNAS